MKKRVLITGVSRGLGKAMALEFQSRGFEVIGVSRSKPDIDIKHIAADITNTDHVELVVNKLKDSQGLDVIINNAGVGIYDSWENLDMHDFRSVMELNVFAQVQLTQKLIPFLKKSKGTIINISSVAGKIYVPYMGVYSVSKFSMSAFSDSLRAELKKDKVKVLNVCPGRINTGFSNRAFGKLKPPKTPFGSTPENFAKAVYKSYRRKKRELIYPSWYELVILVVQMVPWLWDWTNAKRWKRRA